MTYIMIQWDLFFSDNTVSKYKINMMHPVYGMNAKNHAIISTEAEKAWQNSASFHDKNPQHFRNECISNNTGHIRQGQSVFPIYKKQKVFPLKSEVKQGQPLKSAAQQEKQRKST